MDMETEEMKRLVRQRAIVVRGIQGRQEGITELTEKVDDFFKKYDVRFFAPDNIYRMGKNNGSPICVVFATSAIQEIVLGKFSRRDLRKGDSVEAKLPHKDRSNRAEIRGKAVGKPDRTSSKKHQQTTYQQMPYQQYPPHFYYQPPGPPGPTGGPPGYGYGGFGGYGYGQ